MFHRLAIALALSAALGVAGCTSSGSSSYRGPSLEDARAGERDARGNVRAAKRELAKAQAAAKKVALQITRDTNRLKRKVSAKRRAQLTARIKRNKARLRAANRALRQERRDVVRAERALRISMRRMDRTRAGLRRVKRANAEKLARAEERASRRNRSRTASLGSSVRSTGQRLFSRPDPAYAFAGDYAARSDGGWSLPAIPIEQMDKRLLRQEVDYRSAYKPGTVVVDTGAKYLYLVQSRGRALRYGIGVGREGFGWSGTAKAAWKQAWPKWTPPVEMIERQPELAKYCADCGGMPGGITNPLGARAIYLHQGGVDTLYRLHGTPNWRSIGTAASSGCIRMINQDVIDLYSRVRNGATVVVL